MCTPVFVIFGDLNAEEVTIDTIIARISPVLPVTVGGFPPTRGILLAPLHRKGVVVMAITLEELRMFSMFVISLISLIRSEK